MCCVVSGNLLDSESVLTWLLNHSSGEGGLDEVSGTVMDRLVREARNLVVLFCKYAGYVAIALVHTCFLVKHYTNRPGQSLSRVVVSSNGCAIPSRAVGEAESIAPPKFMPLDVVKGMAREAYVLFQMCT